MTKIKQQHFKQSVQNIKRQIPLEDSHSMDIVFKQDKEYKKFIERIKTNILRYQMKSVVQVNRQLLTLYWSIGENIVKKQEQFGWGDAIVEQVAKDLQKAFPAMKGFSRSNIFNMRQWYLFYIKANEKVQQLVGQLPWGHNILIINKIKSIPEAVFYLKETIRNNWSRNLLQHQIELGLFKRAGKSIHNFKTTLPKPQSDLAHQTLKNPYIFDFLNIQSGVVEKDIERQLTKHITKFLLELGTGFSFVGNQYHIEVSNQDYYIDLLFYHLKLHCYVIIELKTGDFKPEYAGKLNFYLSTVDDLIKHPSDNPSIGLILCRTRNEIVVEYALKDITKPIGISEYKLVESIPKEFKSTLPSVEEIETELSGYLQQKKKKKYKK